MLCKLKTLSWGSLSWIVSYPAGLHASFVEANFPFWTINLGTQSWSKVLQCLIFNCKIRFKGRESWTCGLFETKYLVALGGAITSMRDTHCPNKVLLRRSDTIYPNELFLEGLYLKNGSSKYHPSQQKQRMKTVLHGRNLCVYHAGILEDSRRKRTG